MALAVVFSEKKEYTEAEPLKIRLDKGVHEIVGDDCGEMNVTCSHITFVGKGKAQTTTRGGFSVTNQQHGTFEELAVMKPRAGEFGHGFYLEGETNVDVLKCAVNE